MTVKLTAGQNVPLTKENPNLDQLVIGFGWKVVQPRGPQIELVPSAIVTNENDKALSDEHFVFFNQLTSPDSGVKYIEGSDDEQVELRLSLIPPEAKKIVFIVYVNPDVRSAGTFQAVKAGYIRVADENNSEIVRFDIDTSNVSEVTAMIFGEVYRHNGDWKFRAVGQGYTSGISGVARDFNVGL